MQGVPAGGRNFLAVLAQDAAARGTTHRGADASDREAAAAAAAAAIVVGPEGGWGEGKLSPCNGLVPGKARCVRARSALRCRLRRLEGEACV